MSREMKESGGLADVFGAVSGIAASSPEPEKSAQTVSKEKAKDESVRDATRAISPVSSVAVSESPRLPTGRESASRTKTITKPFSIRLTEDERLCLEQQAGKRPLGAYVRHRLFADRVAKRRVSRKPQIDEKQIALVLAELGRSRLSSNLNQLAKAAHTGTLGVSDDVERELLQACASIATMRDTLITALGLKPEGSGL